MIASLLSGTSVTPTPEDFYAAERAPAHRLRTAHANGGRSPENVADRRTNLLVEAVDLVPSSGWMK
jgi:hypothetical protein